MATPDILPGTRFRLYRENNSTPGQYDFVCIAVTLTFNRTADYEDVTLPDCDDPTALPWRASAKRARMWSVNFSGSADVVRLALIEGDFDDDDPHNYQLLMDPSSGTGRTYTGPLHIETLEIGKNNNGIVSFSAQARGDGAYTAADAA